MGNLASISAKIPIEWMDAITAKGKPSAVVRLALAQYLGIEEEIYRDGIPTENPLRSEMDTIKARLSVVERYISENPVYHPPTPKRTTPPKPIATPIPIGAMMTTGQLYQALVLKGYTHTQKTLGKLLKKAIVNQELPEVLTAYGVSADFEVRGASNRFDHTVAWLSLLN